MVCGISGWVDGGEAATGSVKYLIRKLKARRFAKIPSDKFHVFQVPGQLSLRPHVKIENGLLKEHHFPENPFYYWINPDGDHDLILFLGTEPSLNWEGYASAILDLAQEFGTVRICNLGGVLDKTPYRKEPGVSSICSSPELKEEMLRYGVHFTSYEGPGSFGTMLFHLGQSRHMQIVSITARATYYPEYNIIIPYNPKAVRAIVKRLSRMFHITLDTSDLDKSSDEFESKLEFMASHNPEFRNYIDELEKDFIEDRYEEPLDISADEAVRIAEELLRGEKED